MRLVAQKHVWSPPTSTNQNGFAIDDKLPKSLLCEVRSHAANAKRDLGAIGNGVAHKGLQTGMIKRVRTHTNRPPHLGMAGPEGRIRRWAEVHSMRLVRLQLHVAV
ncbi:MAG TPA: hypothetical protein VE868_13230 [Balneolaceae bacterium]|nr:hypothetical protein [Balneolaceae bacterium]